MQRWRASREAAVVVAVCSDRMALEFGEARGGYQLSGEEFCSWQRGFEAYGDGLRATHVRNPGPRPSWPAKPVPAAPEVNLGSPACVWVRVELRHLGKDLELGLQIADPIHRDARMRSVTMAMPDWLSPSLNQSPAEQLAPVTSGFFSRYHCRAGRGDRQQTKENPRRQTRTPGRCG